MIRLEENSWQSSANCAKARAAQSGAAHAGEQKLDEEQRNEVQQLKKIDRKVRAHEMAHSAAGGQYTRGGASYEYKTGPDGKRYAVGGEVSIDSSPVRGDPKATIRKMQVVRKAALAPANPSGRDRAVAAKAAAQEAQARKELQQEEPDGSQAGQELSEKGLLRAYSRNGKRPAARASLGMRLDATA